MTDLFDEPTDDELLTPWERDFMASIELWDGDSDRRAGSQARRNRGIAAASPRVVAGGQAPEAPLTIRSRARPRNHHT